MTRCATGLLQPSSGQVTVFNVGVVPIANLTYQMVAVGGAVEFSAPGNASPCAGPFPATVFSQALGYLEPTSINYAKSLATVAAAMKRADSTLGSPVSGDPTDFALDLNLVLVDDTFQVLPTAVQTVKLQ